MDKIKLWMYRIITLLLVMIVVITNKGVIKEIINRNPNREADTEGGFFVDKVIDLDETLNTSPQEQLNPDQEMLVDRVSDLIYNDDRKPDYKVISELPDEEVPVEFTWTSHEGLYYATVCYSVDVPQYEYFKSLSRYYADDEFVNYINEPINLEYIKMVVGNVEDVANRRGYSEGEKVREAIAFCQQFGYEADGSEESGVDWPKYPIELLYERKGDCEDTSMLLAGVLREMGYSTVLIKYSDHMAVGLLCDASMVGDSYEYEGDKYYYIETTSSGWEIGEMPEEFREVPATIIPVE